MASNYTNYITDQFGNALVGYTVSATNQTDLTVVAASAVTGTDGGYDLQLYNGQWKVTATLGTSTWAGKVFEHFVSQPTIEHEYSLSVSLTPTATVAGFPPGRKLMLTGISAFITTSTTGTPVVTAQVGTYIKATITPIGTVGVIVTGTTVSANTILATENLMVGVTTAGTGACLLTLKYQEKF